MVRLLPLLSRMRRCLLLRKFFQAKVTSKKQLNLHNPTGRGGEPARKGNIKVNVIRIGSRALESCCLQRSFPHVSNNNLRVLQLWWPKETRRRQQAILQFQSPMKVMMFSISMSCIYFPLLTDALTATMLKFLGQ